LADLRTGRPNTRSTPRSPSISITTKSARTKESHTRTKTCSPIPSGYRMVESANCMSIVVWEKSSIFKCFIYYLGHYIHACSQIA
jgi:hypothetical protein